MLFGIIAISPEGPNSQTENSETGNFWRVYKNKIKIIVCIAARSWINTVNKTTLGPMSNVSNSVKLHIVSLVSCIPLCRLCYTPLVFI